MFWWIIGFVVAWVIAVVIEVIWFWGPSEEEEGEEIAPSSAQTDLESSSPPTFEGNNLQQERALGS